METEKVKKGNLTENLVPILLLASVALSFVVGVLWQRVSSLEKGGGGTVAGTTNTGTGQPAANPTSKLADLGAIAVAVGVDKNKFQACVDSKKYEDKINNDFQKGADAGVTGTPGNFIINNKNEGWFVAGALPYDTLKPVVDMALGKAPVTDLSQQGISKLSNEQLAKLPKVGSGDHVRGSSDPSVYLIEYSDFECPFCIRFHSTTQKLVSDYKELAHVLRHYPLDQLHPYARPAAHASECITELGGKDAFWKFADIAFSS